ncbi:hypothetical protein V4F39_20770 [Aquincola sp. MAHUQ-54]|uniref:Uncharacterized protein n=1 Tax=Aquincola agrisoli TaxID=3119538 RepID=A0AAW9Q961_9BURK
MSTITDLYRQRRAASVAHCEAPAPPCSRCGMLACLCRPRFFAGQVLTADDLNRLDAYMRGKHRLHNRQLHGWGVVNGLEVTCIPCGSGVTVSCGYAISPCGDDIVVCEPVAVDVCALIGRCQPVLPVCDPPRPAGSVPCPEAEQEWVLAIRYAEAPTRGVQPLYGAPAAGCGCGNAGCGCGGGAGCTCGGGAKAAAPCPPARPRGAPVQCEPTVVCEGFTFEVYRRPVRNPNDGDDGDRSDAALLRRFQCCVQALLRNAPPQPAEPPTGNPAGWQLWAVRFKAHLLARLSERPGTNCELLARLQALVIPPAGNAAGLPAALQLLAVVFVDALFGCLCSALLPPCPLPSPDERVPLATLHVSGGDCRVLRICNWSTERRIAVTMPALEYWLSTLPFFEALRELLQKACCFDLASLLRGDRQDDAPGAAGTVGALRAAAPGDLGDRGALADERATLRLNPQLDDPQPLQGFSRAFAQSLFTPGRTITAEALLDGLLSGRGDLALDAGALPGWLAANQLGRPIGSVFGAELAAVFRPDADTAGLQRTVAELAARVKVNEVEIAALRGHGVPGADPAGPAGPGVPPASPGRAKRGRK